MENNKKNNNGVERAIDIRKIFAILRKNWLVLSRDRIRLVPLFVFPFVIVILFGYTAGTLPKHIPAAIADYDNTQLSRSVEMQLYSNELFSIIRQVGSQDEGKKMMDQGQIQVLFIIPKGFEDDIQSGKVAQLGVMVDQSNPTVAQITSASTQLFVQALSQQLNEQRISMLAQQALQAQLQLGQAKAALLLSLNQNNEPTLAEMSANFRQAQYIGTETNEVLGSSIQSMQNSVGYVINPYDVVSAYASEPVGSTGSLYLLSISDRQQSQFQQIAAFQGLQGSNDAMLYSLQKLYAGSRALNANAERSQQAAMVSYNLIDAASGNVEEIVSGAQNIAANQNPLVINQIQPYGNGLRGLDYLLPNILGFIAFQGAAMALGRAIAGERKDGSLTRVFLTPTSNVTIITGTLLFYVIQETIRTMLIVLAAIAFFGLIVRGSLLSILFIVALFALGATGVGMIISVITRSQEQYMAVSMLVTLPMIFLSGLFAPIETMPTILQEIAKIIPITYAADALQGVIVKGFTLGQVFPDLAFLAAFGLITITMSLLLFKRELI